MHRCKGVGDTPAIQGCKAVKNPPFARMQAARHLLPSNARMQSGGVSSMQGCPPPAKDAKPWRTPIKRLQSAGDAPRCPAIGCPPPKLTRSRISYPRSPPPGFFWGVVFRRRPRGAVQGSGVRCAPLRASPRRSAVRARRMCPLRHRLRPAPPRSARSAPVRGVGAAPSTAIDCADPSSLLYNFGGFLVIFLINNQFPILLQPSTTACKGLISSLEGAGSMAMGLEV